MDRLLRKPMRKQLDEGVSLIQEVNAGNSPLEYVSFKILELTEGAEYKEKLEKQECCIVVIAGKISVSAGNDYFTNVGTRKSAFDQIPTDSVYIPNDHSFVIVGETQARVALCYALSTSSLPVKLIKSESVKVEKRGKFNNQRLVYNILSDRDPYASALLVVEVYTPSGNWSSYPPHKHDRDCLPQESMLEETYYHEINPPQGFVFQRVYTDDRLLDQTMTVENGDVVIIPKGYHPVGVPDGYTSYYLNVMAGPKRIWKFYHDPNHEWILKR